MVAPTVSNSTCLMPPEGDVTTVTWPGHDIPPSVFSTVQYQGRHILRWPGWQRQALPQVLRQRIVGSGWPVVTSDSKRQSVVTSEPDTVTRVGVDTRLLRSWLRLAELQQLGPQWDSYDAEPITKIAVEKARLLLTLVCDAMTPVASEHYHPWVIVPMTDGGVQLEWRHGERELEIEVGPSGTYGYLLIEGRGGERRFGEGADISIGDVLSLIESVVLQ